MRLNSQLIVSQFLLAFLFIFIMIPILAFSFFAFYSTEATPGGKCFPEEKEQN